MVQNQKEEAVQQDLLVYIKSMPEHQLQVTAIAYPTPHRHRRFSKRLAKRNRSTTNTAVMCRCTVSIETE